MAPKKLNYSLLNSDDGEFITVVASGHDPKTARDDHPNYEKIVELVRRDDISALDLFDITVVVEQKFRRLSDRVTTKNGRIYFDGDEIDNALTQQILRFIEDGEDFEPLVNFFENVAANPVEHSKQQLYRFLANNGMVVSLTEDGKIVAYKGMYRHEDDEGVYYTPTHHGHVIVDGVDGQSDELKQRVGSVVEMPRSEVRHDPSQHCSVGLHISTFNYARTYGSVRLEVQVDPRDVVSVPNDTTQKVRACRYKIIGEVDSPYAQAVVRNEVTIEPEEEPQEIELTPVKESTPSHEWQSTEPAPEARFEVPESVTDEYPAPAPVQTTVPESVTDEYSDLDAAPERFVSNVRLSELGNDQPAEQPWIPSQEELDEIGDQNLVAQGYVGATDPRSNPTEVEFEQMQGRAKRRRRNFVKYASKHGEGWEFVGEDPNNRLDWVKG